MSNLTTINFSPDYKIDADDIHDLNIKSMAGSSANDTIYVYGKAYESGGDDKYYLDNISYGIITNAQNPGGGTDTLISSVSIDKLYDNIENLELVSYDEPFYANTSNGLTKIENHPFLVQLDYDLHNWDSNGNFKGYTYYYHDGNNNDTSIEIRLPCGLVAATNTIRIASACNLLTEQEVIPEFISLCDTGIFHNSPYNYNYSNFAERVNELVYNLFDSNTVLNFFKHGTSALKPEQLTQLQNAIGFTKLDELLPLLSNNGVPSSTPWINQFYNPQWYMDSILIDGLNQGKVFMLSADYNVLNSNVPIPFQAINHTLLLTGIARDVTGNLLGYITADPMQEKPVIYTSDQIYVGTHGFTQRYLETENIKYWAREENQTGVGNDLTNQITGNSGDNKLYGLDKDDIIKGGDGLDHIYGGNDNDSLYGEDGNDYIYGDSGDDIELQGNAGDDWLYGGIGNDKLLGGADSDHLYGEGDKDTLDGGSEVDYLYGGGDIDKLYGQSGNDYLYGEEGNDVLYGEDDNDENFQGTTGKDWLYGGIDNDKLYGGGNNDRLFGGSGGDILFGGKGDDIIYGDGNNSTSDNNANNNSGKDIIFGNEGNDIIYGGKDDDIIDPGNGLIKNLDGGTGNDQYAFESVGSGFTTITDPDNHGGGIFLLPENNYNEATIKAELDNQDNRLKGGKQILSGGIIPISLYKDNEHPFITYQWGGNAGSNLIITNSNNLSVTLVKDFINNKLGINLMLDNPPDDPLKKLRVYCGGKEIDLTSANPDFSDCGPPGINKLMGIAWNLLQNVFGNIDPLVFDLDNDGIESTSVYSSEVFFDLDNDTFDECCGWISADDGLLIIDQNNNGNVDDIGELFGDRTTSGFEELKLHDSNADGKIDVNDADYAIMKIWQDYNQNGINKIINAERCSAPAKITFPDRLPVPLMRISKAA